MRSVKLIYPGWLTAPNGANTVMNSLLESKEQFSKVGFSLSSLSFDTYNPRSFSNDDMATPQSQWRARLKRWLKAASRYSRLAAFLVMYITEFKPGKKFALDYINSNPDKDEIVFFHSLIPCYYYLRYRKYYQHTLAVFHTNGESFKMERIYYPALEKSFTLKRMKRMEDFVIKNADRINFVAEYSMNNFLRLHPEININKVSFVHNGIAEQFECRESGGHRDCLEICCVASISKRKGQHYIIEALQRFKHEEMPKVHFTFVGEGSDRISLENEVFKNNLCDYVKFAGVTNNVDSFLNDSDIYILPSEDEGLPMAIIEAMRASLPIISTRVGGIPEMIEDGINGVFIEPNADSIYDLLMSITSYNWEDMGKRSYETFCEKFVLTKMVDGYIKLLTFD